VQGHHEQALDIVLRVSDPKVFAYIRKFHLYNAAAQNAARLMNIDEAAAVDLFVGSPEAAPVALVVSDLQRVEQIATSGGSGEDAQVWRRRLFKYLHGLFKRERRASHNYHDLQVLSISVNTCLCFIKCKNCYSPRIKEHLLIKNKCSQKFCFTISLPGSHHARISVTISCTISNHKPLCVASRFCPVWLSQQHHPLPVCSGSILANALLAWISLCTRTG
jgi:hypothetical protein